MLCCLGGKGMNDKTKFWIHKLFWVGIVALIIFLPIIINAFQPELKLIDDEVSGEYYSTLNESCMEAKLTFNRPVDSGYATIKFYDEYDNLLKTVKCYFSCYGESAEDSYIEVDGNVDSYELVSYDFEPAFVGGWMYALLIFVIPFFIVSMFLSYKEYEYNGKKLSVYAGWFNYILRVDGKICDKHCTFIYFTPIKLTTTLDDGTKLEGTISLIKRITLKADDKLLSK